MKIKGIDKYGNAIWLDDDEPIPDQCGISVSAFLMDGTDGVQRAIASSRPTTRAIVTDSLGAPAGHKPGFCFDSKLSHKNHIPKAKLVWLTAGAPRTSPTPLLKHVAPGPKPGTI